MKEAAVWANPNDLAILLTGGYYSEFENAALSGSTVCVANSQATKQDFMKGILHSTDWDCEVIHWGGYRDVHSTYCRKHPNKTDS